MLVRDGKPYEVTARMSEQLHPRSALGWNAKYLYLVVADGRQPGLSVGIRLAEMADFMIALGCGEVINMDGGLSTTLMLNGKVINHPSDGARTSRDATSTPGKEREVANAIVVLRKPVVEGENGDQ
jgi:exopolysaccharide biosynthesis protein